MAYRFNPAPGWPQPPEGWSPPEGWQPDPAWPPAPEGWEFWIWQDDAAGGAGQAPIEEVITEPAQPDVAQPAPVLPEPEPTPVVSESPMPAPVEQIPEPAERVPAAQVDEPSASQPVAEATWTQPETPAPAPDVPEPQAEVHPDPAPAAEAAAMSMPQAAPMAEAPTPVAQSWGVDQSAHQQQQWAHATGAAQAAAPVQQSTPVYNTPQPAPHHHAPAKKSGKGALVFLIILAVILAIAFVGALATKVLAVGLDNAEPAVTVAAAVLGLG